MITDIKILIDALSSMTNGALWAIIIYVIYKLVTFGSVLLVVKYAIGLLYNWVMTTKTVTEVVQIGNDIIARDVYVDGLKTAFRDVAKYKSGLSGRYDRYLCSQGVTFITEAINEKLEKEKETK